MNIYNDFFHQMNPDEWEYFSSDFLNAIGYTIICYPSKGADGGMDLLVENGGIRYLVSCKHFIESGKAVGLGDEPSILDRVAQHGANGFIGFYSTIISSGLAERLTKLECDSFHYIIYDQSSISNFLPRIHSLILQKYGLPNKIKFVMNVKSYEYKSLQCLGCGIDILREDMIHNSMALVSRNKKDELEYIYGCKKCVGNINDLGWVEVNQSLHQEQLNGWIKHVDTLIEQHAPSKTFYKHRSEYESSIQQRMFPSNWGQWLA